MKPIAILTNLPQLSASAFALLGWCVFGFFPVNRYWIGQMPGPYIESALRLASAIAFTSVCALQTVNIHISQKSGLLLTIL